MLCVQLAQWRIGAPSMCSYRFPSPRFASLEKKQGVAVRWSRRSDRSKDVELGPNQISPLSFSLCFCHELLMENHEKIIVEQLRSGRRLREHQISDPWEILKKEVLSLLRAEPAVLLLVIITSLCNYWYKQTEPASLKDLRMLFEFTTCR